MENKEKEQAKQIKEEILIQEKANDNNFNDNKKIKNNAIKNFSTQETILLVIISLLVGLLIGNLLVDKEANVKKAITKDSYLQEFVENYEYILNNYYEEIDKEALINSAISGMMESLDDPYSMYFNEEESNNFSITLDGSYEGIGVQITKDDSTGYMLIVSVFKNSPAEQAGLKSGDKIMSISEKSVAEMTASEFTTFIRNSDSSVLNFKIIREEETLNIKLSKKTVTLSSVTSKTYEVNNKKVGYIYIGIFANNTAEQFKTELNKLEVSNIEYLIIDVRGNTGGHLTSVDSILDMFLNSNQIMYQFEQNGKTTPIYGNGKDNKSYDIILLGDVTSASASEVLIAGLKENLNSKFIGEKTYGKGTVQELITLKDGTQYKITVKKWLTPKGNWVDDTGGISPDIVVKLSEEYYMTYSDEDDTQLQSAFEYIRSITL